MRERERQTEIERERESRRRERPSVCVSDFFFSFAIKRKLVERKRNGARASGLTVARFFAGRVNLHQEAEDMISLARSLVNSEI